MSKFTPGDWHVSELDATGEKSEHYIFIEPGVAVIERTAGGSQCDMADAHLLAASKIMLEALEHARMFIRNGVDLGYITMPDADTEDPAHDTLPMIEAAIAKARGES